MTKALFQFATLVVASSAFAAVEKGSHEGLLLDSHIKYSDSTETKGREVEAKVILNGESWTLVARTPEGNVLYGRETKIAAPVANATAEQKTAAALAEPKTADAAIAANTDKTSDKAVDGETVQISYREVTPTGAELKSWSVSTLVGSNAAIDTTDVHINLRVSKIRYQLE